MQGSKPDVPHLLSSDSGIQTHSWGVQATIAGQPSYASSPSTVAWSEQAPSSEFDDVDSGKEFSASPLVEPITDSGFQIAPTAENVTFDKSTSIRSSASRPYTRRQTDSGLWNSFSANDTVAGNIVSRKSHETDHRSSQDIGNIYVNNSRSLKWQDSGLLRCHSYLLHHLTFNDFILHFHALY